MQLQVAFIAILIVPLRQGLNIILLSNLIVRKKSTIYQIIKFIHK